MKLKILIITLTLLLVSIVPVFADGPVITDNAKLIIYERFVNENTYTHLGSTSIWKSNSEYANLIQDGWSKETPDKSIKIKRGNDIWN